MSKDVRLGDLMTEEKSGDELVQLIGFPSDEGVKINGGRPGSSKAPGLIFEQLKKLTPHAEYGENHTELLKRTAGFTYVLCTGNVENDQEKLGEFVASTLENNQIPVILGGGHETSFGHFLGYAKAGKEVSILNIDAHTDVRDLKNGRAHSGSPFKQALEHSSGLCKSYHVFGLNPASVSKEHLEFVQKNGSAVFEQNITKKAVLNRLSECSSPVMVTMDMDIVNQSQAPGVSAPNGSGISSDLWLDLAFEFGKHPGVTSFDLCEVNPEYDRDYQTVKLAALSIWYFLLGVSLRD